MKRIKALCLAGVLAFILIGCGEKNNEMVETGNVPETEVKELQEIEISTEQVADESEETDVTESDDSYVADEIADRVYAYFVGEEVLDNTLADNMNDPTIRAIRQSGKQVKFIKILFKYEDAWMATPTPITDTLSEGTYGVASIQLNELMEGAGDDIYYLSVITCADDVSFDNFKASWEFYKDLEKNIVEIKLVEEIAVDDGTLVLDGLEKCNIYNFDDGYYALCNGFESFDSTTNDGITTNYSGLRFVHLKGDKDQLDFSMFALDTTFEEAKELFAELNYENLGRFANRDWLCNKGYHPVYDVVLFKSVLEKERMEAYYLLLGDYINDTGYEGEDDMLVTYTNKNGEVIDIKHYSD